METEEKKPVCALCLRPATHFVVVQDKSRSYKYGECFRCKVHKERAESYFKKVMSTPVDEYMRKRRKGL